MMTERPQPSVRQTITPSLVESAALLATMGMIFLTGFLTLATVSTGGSSTPHIDKVYHLAAFACIILPCARFYWRSLVWLIPLTICLGGGIELIQPHVGRDGDWLDFLADVTGIGVGIAVGRMWSRLSFRAK